MRKFKVGDVVTYNMGLGKKSKAGKGRGIVKGYEQEDMTFSGHNDQVVVIEVGTGLFVVMHQDWCKKVRV